MSCTVMVLLLMFRVRNAVSLFVSTFTIFHVNGVSQVSLSRSILLNSIRVGRFAGVVLVSLGGCEVWLPSFAFTMTYSTEPMKLVTPRNHLTGVSNGIVELSFG